MSDAIQVTAFADLGPARPHRSYAAAKRAMDFAVALLLLPSILLVALVLLAINPFLNRGSLFFVQERMGQGCRPFRAWKFRTMTSAPTVERGPFDALETKRITPLGGLLRRARVDELPQVFNVLRGEMSLIGPRPDYYAHAVAYLDSVQGYRERHAVLPGISGFAQTEVGYVDDLDGIREKVAADLHYVRHASLRLDLWIAWRTVGVMLRQKGA